MKRRTRPPFWLRALGLKMIGYLRGNFTHHSLPMRPRFAIGFAKKEAWTDRSNAFVHDLEQSLNRQPHHIFKASVNAGNNQLAMFLNAVSASFVEGVDL